MSYDIDRCIIPKVWCGNSNTIPKKNKKQYYKVGTRYECLKSGFGAGMHTEKRKGFDDKSLQQIPYVGPKMEKKLKKRGIANTKQLISELRDMSANEKRDLLKSTLKNSNGQVNNFAYNSVIRYLYENGVLDLPKCKEIQRG